MASTDTALNQRRDPERDRRLLVNISRIINTLNQKGIKFNKRLDKILEILLDYMGVEQGSIMVLEKDTLTVEAASRREIIGASQSLDSDSIAAWVAKSRQPIFIPDIAKDPRFESAKHDRHYKKNALLSVPVIQEDRLLGVINITDRVGDKNLLHEDVTCLLDFSGMIISTLVQRRLQNELRQKKNTLKKRNQELRRQEGMRDDLYQLLIHDLKAPLAEVVANLDIMSYSISGENREFLEAAQMGCDRAVRMVINLVTINKMEDGKLQIYPEEVVPKALIAEANSAIRGLARIKDVTLVMDAPQDLPTIYIDRTLILRVLQNLLTNALGYTTPSTTITTGCRKVPDRNKLEFFVQDQGPGLAQDKQHTIFEKYSRLSDKQDALVGTGLGLYFCRLALENHHGKIGITSEPGHGCRFFFTLNL
ncbi:MAG: GAF domain-containing sensor histidine kinase [Deltaproteobacteria bacterium]|nr:GAF domain-containing sensor histidine kinase [Deltaproteobacteria bacterium]